MPSYINTDFHENIIHETESIPYSIHYTEVPSEYTQALYLHWHDEMEFLFLVSGEVIFYVEDKKFPLKAGEGIFIPPGLMHQAIRNSASSVAFYAFVLSTDMISSINMYLYNNYILPIRHHNLAYVTTLRSDIDWQNTILHYLQTLFLTSGQNELHVLGTTFFIWEQLYKNHIKFIPTKHNLTKLACKLQPALNFIHTHYQEKITLPMLASCVFLSVSEFCRAFKSLTGISPIAYLVRHRIQQSCITLSQTTLSVSEIALSHGFNSISYFNRTFVKLIGMTPSAYRKNSKVD